MALNQRFPQLPRAYHLFRSDGLARQIQWAYTAGMDKGFSDPDGKTSMPTSTTPRVYGKWNGPPNPTNYERYVTPLTMLLEGGVAGAGLNIFWTAPSQQKDDYDTTFGFTAFALVKPKNVVTGAGGYKVLAKRTTAFNSAGWGIYQANDGTYSFEWGDATHNPVLNSGFPSVNNVPNVLCVVNRPEQLLAEFWIDGVLQATLVTSSTTKVIGNNHAEPIRMMGPEGANNSAIKVSAAAVWSRALERAEIQRISTDPYILFRHYLGYQTLSAAGLGMGVNPALSYFMAF
jgi:hypothetical protein